MRFNKSLQLTRTSAYADSMPATMMPNLVFVLFIFKQLSKFFDSVKILVSEKLFESIFFFFFIVFVLNDIIGIQTINDNIGNKPFTRTIQQT